MFIRQYSEKVTLPMEVYKQYNMNSIAYFDIETTGFVKDSDRVILISLGCYVDESNFNLKQYYAEKLEEEADILQAFKEDIKKFDRWCSYNGIAFDEPFIKKRMQYNQIAFEAPQEHLDIYRLIRPYYKQLGMERCNLKTVEKYIGIEREDKIDGGISVELYNEYLSSKDEGLRNLIMLHNYEDVLNLPSLFNLIYNVENDPNLKREDSITEKQLKFLKSLLKKNNISLCMELEKISKKAAARVIDCLLKGNAEVQLLTDIINNSY